jgi:hypothetical protein
MAARLAALPLEERESEIARQALSGNVPHFLRTLCPVRVTNSEAGCADSVTLYVTPDYLAVGSDDDYLLIPIRPDTAQRIADHLGCSLPTKKMVDDIYGAATVRLPPSPIPPSPAMTTVAVFQEHNATVRAQRLDQAREHPLGELVAGHKKDIVITPKLAAAPGKVAIYGWHRTNGIPIQPLYLGHTAAWVDYSQCTRLVLRDVTVNGKATTVSRILADPNLARLLSDEGVVPVPRYPTNTSPPVEPRTNADARAVRSTGFAAFEASSFPGERVASFILDPEVKVVVNAPAEKTFEPKKTVCLVFYALPNGNTTEQTIGRILKPGDDWHFDIQHIGAQTRFLRETITNRALVVVYLEAAMKSWPAWRKKHGDAGIPGFIESVRKVFSGNRIEMVLSGHSGGGSFTFGYLNAVERIPDDVVRIAFLDSNYAYDSAKGHTEKLVRWLEHPPHALCVLGYDDANALLDGKPFVSAAGGTWGRSHEMQRDLARAFHFAAVTNAGFERYTALEGRLRFILKNNPERKIYHTVQVERNGFIHSLLFATPFEDQGYAYFGERAYSRWITE